jgi:3-isopropylmalate dehydrogenase
MNANIVVLAGDGIGPEVVAEARKVLTAVGEKFNHTFRFDEQLMGGRAIDELGTSLPDETVAACKQADAVLLGAVGGPKWDNPHAKDRPERGLLGIRKALNLFANLRPVKLNPQLISASTIKEDVLRGTDMLVIRELTGGVYFGPRKEAGDEAQEAYDTMLYTRPEIERVVRLAADAARGRRKKLASVDKFNVLASSRLWRRVATEVLADYPDLEVEHVLVDAMAMHLIRRPASFDVIVAENLFGDILTDEAAMLAGSMGMLPSASLGDLINQQGLPLGLYEPIHGSAPDIAGKGIANPLATILSTAMLLRLSLGLEREAQALEAAVDAVLADGVRTPDIADTGTEVVATQVMGDLVVEKLLKS